MRDTVEDQTMVREHQYRPIADCNLAGPIAYDLIMSKEAARLKGYDCPWCGEFDGIVVPNLMSGNLLVKVLQHNAGATGCGILVGAKIPVAICSRSDDPGQAYLSLAACAAMWASGKYF
jgi:phosphotransacetylase